MNLLRWRGYSLIAIRQEPPPQLSPQRRWQFSISGILALTLVVAIVTAAATKIRWKNGLDEELPLILLLAISSAFAVPWIVWGALTSGSIVPRLLIAAVVSLVVAGLWLIAWPFELRVLAAVTVGQNLLLASAMLCVRAAGYRLMRTIHVRSARPEQFA
jgi:hypothetical protein